MKGRQGREERSGKAAFWLGLAMVVLTAIATFRPWLSSARSTSLRHESTLVTLACTVLDDSRTPQGVVLFGPGFDSVTTDPNGNAWLPATWRGERVSVRRLTATGKFQEVASFVVPSDGSRSLTVTIPSK